MRRCFSLLLITCILITLCSCAQKNNIKIKSFTYKIDVEITSDTIGNELSDFLLQKYGDSLKLLLDNKGNILFNYYGTGNYGYDYCLYNVETNHYYTKWKSIDTLFHYDVISNTLKMNSLTQSGSKKVNNIECKVIEIKAVDSQNPGQYVNQTFYYNKDTLNVDAEKYKNYKEFFFYKFLNKTHCFYVKKIIEMPQYRITYTLINSEYKGVEPHIFNVPQNIALKEY